MDYSSLIQDKIVSTALLHNTVCELCDTSYQRLNRVIIESGLEYNMCEFCKVTLTYDKNDTYKIIVLKSSLSQRDIIDKTIEFFNKNGSVPSPHNIDQDAKRIDISSQLVKYLLFNSESLNKKFNDKNFRIFMTPAINIHKFIVRNMFAVQSQNSNYWQDIKNMDVYKVPTKIKNKIDTFMCSIQIKEIESSRERFTKKIDNLNNILDTISELSELSDK
jgi:hypothetical protein